MGKTLYQNEYKKIHDETWQQIFRLNPQEISTNMFMHNLFFSIISQVRPQFRPGFRRPTITAQQKKSKPTQSNDINDTTETSSVLTTRKSSSSPYARRRSRPTYIPTTSHTTVTAAAAAAIAANVAQRNNDTIVGKILQRRKLSRPSAVAITNTNSNNSERKRTNASLQSKGRPTTESGKREHTKKNTIQ